MFFAWFGRRIRAVWLRPHEGDRKQVLLERASALILALLLAHSLVDYPLRTTALSAIFAFFSAILASPMSATRLERVSVKRSRDHQERRQRTRREPMRSPPTFTGPKAGSVERKDLARL